MIESLISSVLMFAAIFALGLVAVCVIMLISYSMQKDCIGSVAGAIECFFGPGCRISMNNHVITVMQTIPLLELGAAFSKFSHSYRWRSRNRRFIGIPVPFTWREAFCTHICAAKGGFNFKNQFCSFNFSPTRSYSLAALYLGKQYDVRVTLPEPMILSVETLDVCIMNTTNWVRIWATLTEEDRNAIISEIFPETRKHLECAGRPLLDEAKNRLENGLRKIMPNCVRRIEFEWCKNPRAFDFELSVTGRMIRNIGGNIWTI